MILIDAVSNTLQKISNKYVKQKKNLQLNGTSFISIKNLSKQININLEDRR